MPSLFCCSFFIPFFFKLIVACRLCVIYVSENNDSNVQAMITRLLWTTWTSLSAVRERPLKLTHSPMLYGITRPQWVECNLNDFQISLQWRHNGYDSISNHQPHDCLLNRLFRRKSKKTSKLSVTGLCAGNSPGTGECPMASYVENISIWWRHHVLRKIVRFPQKIHWDVFLTRGSYCLLTASHYVN